MRTLIVIALFALAACTTAPAPPAAELPATTRTLSLTGQLTRADHQTYREIPFTVPPGVARLSIELTYARDNRTVIDLGLRDPNGQRGWSGGNKSRIFISETDATPSYRAGPLTPGTWRIVLGIPNIREGVTASYEATITLEPAAPAAATAFLATPISTTPGWRRGDFHTHTAHSDGSCEAAPGQRIPCPVHRTLDAARNAKLDFVAVTDHNTLTQANSLRELQPAYPNLLVIPGAEITTFRGHANAIGLAHPVDFQLGSPRLPDVKSLLDQTEAQGAFLSINHPGQPSAEICMGCGWSAGFDPRIAAVEIANGSAVRTGVREGPLSGFAFWEARLNEGHRLTAIGGSDNHDATDATGARQSPVGSPATVVWADELSAKGIVDGVRSGRVFIDMENVPGRLVDIRAIVNPTLGAPMGGILEMPAHFTAALSVSVAGITDYTTQIVSSGLDMIEAPPLSPDRPAATFTLRPGATFGWVRVNIRDATGKLQLVSNPVYVKAKP